MIQVKLIPAYGCRPRPCHSCGGWSDDTSVLAEVTAPGRLEGFRVCQKCLEAGDIDTILSDRAALLEQNAELLRALVGRLKVPTYAEYRAAEEASDAEKSEWYAADAAHHAAQEAGNAALRAHLQEPMPAANDAIPAGDFEEGPF